MGNNTQTRTESGGWPAEIVVVTSAARQGVWREKRQSTIPNCPAITEDSILALPLLTPLLRKDGLDVVNLTVRSPLGIRDW